MSDTESSEENLPKRDSIHDNSFQSYLASLLLLFNCLAAMSVSICVCDFEGLELQINIIHEGALTQTHKKIRK